jgi:hypothetical protein
MSHRYTHVGKEALTRAAKDSSRNQNLNHEKINFRRFAALRRQHMADSYRVHYSIHGSGRD